MKSAGCTTILGIGTDFVDVRRIEAVLKRHSKDRFVSRIFTIAEIAYCESASHFERRVLRYANRFAAKEAAYKALGAHKGTGITWQDIEVISDKETRAPSLYFSGNTALFIEKKITHPQMEIRTHLSLSDEYPYALAFVIISMQTSPNL